MVYQERFISRYNIPPLQVAGWEGIFGFISLSLLFIPVSEKTNYEKESRILFSLVELYYMGRIQS